MLPGRSLDSIRSTSVVAPSSAQSSATTSQATTSNPDRAASRRLPRLWCPHGGRKRRTAPGGKASWHQPSWSRRQWGLRSGNEEWSHEWLPTA
jgi:hypothetical protein